MHCEPRYVNAADSRGVSSKFYHIGDLTQGRGISPGRSLVPNTRTSCISQNPFLSWNWVKGMQ